MNIQEFIKAKEEEFDEKFTVKSNAGNGLLRYTDADGIKHFISQSLLEYNEKIKEMIESEKWVLIEGKLAQFQKDRNKALDDIITNLNIK